MASAIEEEERTLTALYAQRQELLKDLTEVDNQIKNLEHKQMHRQREVAQQRQAQLLVSTGDKDLDSIREIIEKATHDQMGLREAQKAVEAACRAVERLEGESDEDLEKRRRYRNLFIQHIIERSRELMVDPHGNYFVQRAIGFFKSGGSVAPPAGNLDYDVLVDSSLSEVIALLEHLGTGVCDVACNMHGTRAVQRLIDSLQSVEEFELFCDLVANDLVTLIKDLNGNHSISRLLVSQSFMKLGEAEPGAPVDEVLREKGQSVRKDVYHVVAANCVEICRNRQGCCIIQRCLQWAPEPFRTEIINAALLNSLKLVQDPFGNYVVQYILDLQQQLVQHNPAEAEAVNYTNRIIRQILHNIALLSCNKFSSNVIEKCLKTASPDVRQLLIDELTDPHALPKLLTDSFANYVIQTAITTATDEAQFSQLRDAILPLQHLLKNSPYGIKIEAKLVKRHRDAAKKLSRQIRAQREGQRPNAGGGGSPTQGQPPGPLQQQQPPPPQQQQLSNHHPHLLHAAQPGGRLDVHVGNGAAPQIPQAIRIAQAAGFAQAQPGSDANFAFFAPQSLGQHQHQQHQHHAQHQQQQHLAQHAQQQQQQQQFHHMHFMVPPTALLGTAMPPAGAGQPGHPSPHGGSGAQPVVFSLPQHPQQHPQHPQQQPQQQQQQFSAPPAGATSWAVSSQGGYTALQQQHQTAPQQQQHSQQRGGIGRGAPPPGIVPASATHSPYTTIGF